MKELESKINIKIKSQPDFDKSLKSQFADYDIKYKSFSVIWEITNQAYHHSLWYNPNKASIVKSSIKKEPKALIIINFLMVIVILATFIMHKLYGWFSDVAGYHYVILVVVFALVNWLFYKLKPQHKADLVEEHNKIVDLVKSI